MILVLRHESFEHLGYFSQRLKEVEIPFQYIDLVQPLDHSVEQGDISGVIVMGGPQSANDADPGLAAEMKLIDSALTRGVPILGICLGAQLLAKTLGARVYRNPVREIGWEPVYFTPAASGDPVFGGFPTPATFLHWHGETFDMPHGAEWLAYSDKCRHQVFRYGRNAYGIQFHPEITPEMIADWSAQPSICRDGNTLESAIDPVAFDTSQLSRKVLDGWLSTFKWTSPAENASDPRSSLSRLG